MPGSGIASYRENSGLSVSDSSLLGGELAGGAGDSGCGELAGSSRGSGLGEGDSAGRGRDRVEKRVGRGVRCGARSAIERNEPIGVEATPEGDRCCCDPDATGSEDLACLARSASRRCLFAARMICSGSGSSISCRGLEGCSSVGSVGVVGEILADPSRWAPK